MSGQSDRRRARASLRGRGREILTGHPADDPRTDAPHVEPLHLTQDEADALLDMGAIEQEALIPAWQREPEQEETSAPDELNPPDTAYDDEIAAMSDEITEADDLLAVPPEADEDGPEARILPVLAEMADLVEAWPDDATDGEDVPDDEPMPDSKPLGQPVSLASLLDAPLWFGGADVEADEEPDAEPDIAEDDGLVPDVEAGPERPHFLPEFDRLDTSHETIDLIKTDPPATATAQPGEHLPVAYGAYGELAAVVDDEALRRLVAQIEALQDELAQALEFDPAVVEGWQRQLFEAHMHLMQSRTAYEAARMTVVGIQTEMNRQRQVRRDVMRYRPLLLNYIVGWGIAWGVLMALKSMVVGVADTIGLTLVAAAYYPTLFGILGALVGSFLALERHAVRQRDFDPLYITGYLANPLLGAAAGLLTFLAFGLANHNALDGTTTDLERIVLWIAAAVIGLNQSAILRRAASLFRHGAPDQST